LGIERIEAVSIEGRREDEGVEAIDVILLGYAEELEPSRLLLMGRLALKMWSVRRLSLV
jgi:hypothetical protein